MAGGLGDLQTQCKVEGSDDDLIGTVRKVLSHISKPLPSLSPAR